MSYLYDDDDANPLQEIFSGTFHSRDEGDFTTSVETFAYDDDGNMTLRTDAATSDTIAYRWDDQDNLIRVAFSPADTKVLHTYDAGGIRKAKILDDETVTESFYSGLPTLNEVETPAVGSPVEFNYLMGHQLMGFESGGDFFYLLTDGLTSVRIVVDGSGDEVAAYEYLEFGEQTKTGSGSSPKTFVGGLGVHDDSALTNLLYMRARHYDARLGRFLNRDPIGFAGGLGPYGYVGGNPVNSVDARGLGYIPIQDHFDLPPSAGTINGREARGFGGRIFFKGNCLCPDGYDQLADWAIDLGGPNATFTRAVGTIRIYPSAVEIDPSLLRNPREELGIKFDPSSVNGVKFLLPLVYTVTQDAQGFRAEPVLDGASAGLRFQVSLALSKVEREGLTLVGKCRCKNSCGDVEEGVLLGDGVGVPRLADFWGA
ncbi:MAG: RHS repeat domain-containing protein [Vulcanimicrobiota bacterium]